MNATDFVRHFIELAHPTRLTIRRDIWAHLIVENSYPIPYLPFPEEGTFYGVPVKQRLTQDASA